MWAVGALAWELLTGRPLFGDNFSDEDVVMVLLGFKPLPFEADPSLWVLFTESQVLPGYSLRTHVRMGCMEQNFIGVNAYIKGVVFRCICNCIMILLQSCMSICEAGMTQALKLL